MRLITLTTDKMIPVLVSLKNQSLTRHQDCAKSHLVRMALSGMLTSKSVLLWIKNARLGNSTSLSTKLALINANLTKLTSKKMILALVYLLLQFLIKLQESASSLNVQQGKFGIEL